MSQIEIFLFYFFSNLSLRSKSNQNEQKTRLNENTFKEIKMLSSSQTRLDSIVMQKNLKAKNSGAYETILMDENSSTDIKCPFNFGKFFSNHKNYFFG